MTKISFIVFAIIISLSCTNVKQKSPDSSVSELVTEKDTSREHNINLVQKEAPSHKELQSKSDTLNNEEKEILVRFAKENEFIILSNDVERCPSGKLTRG